MAPTHTEAIPIFILPDDLEDGYNIVHFYLKRDEEYFITLQPYNTPASVLEQN